MGKYLFYLANWDRGFIALDSRIILLISSEMTENKTNIYLFLIISISDVLSAS